MPTIDVECSECATILAIEEARLGTDLKCPKCKTVFLAEKSAAYELADPLPHPTSARPARNPSSSPRPEPHSRPETDADRRQRELMEKWAEE